MLRQVVSISTKHLRKSSARSARLYSTIPAEALVARFKTHGSPKSVLTLEKEKLPSSLKDDEVLVKMLFAPINPSDINMIEGTYPVLPSLPAVAGNEGVGQIVAVGGNVKNVKPNDFVLPSKPGFGTWRNYAVVSSKSVSAVHHPALNNVKPEYLAALSVNPLTALRLLEDFEQLNKGDVVIQNGANSMVGQCVLQLAKLKGVKTINIIREERPGYEQVVERMKQHGGYIVCGDKYLRTAQFRDLIKDLPQPKLALNCTGGETVTEMSRLLAPGGTLVTYGGMARRPVTVPTSALLFKDIKLRGFWLTAWNEQHPDKRAQSLEQLIGLVAEEKLRLWVERHSLTSLNLALQRSEEPFKDRKVLLSLQQ